ncbi:OmpA family protein [Salinihabitans flavidus]|nr:OmpA family protein [Salinihabitans flavidus]
MILLLMPGTAMAVECGYCEGRSLRELLNISGFSGSDSLRPQIRGWIAERHPDTAEGHFARGWLGSSRGEPAETVIGHYRRAVELAPNMPLGYGNLGYEYNKVRRYEEEIAVYERAVRNGAGVQYLFLNGYFNIRDGQDRGAEEAEAWLRRMDAPDWVIAYARGRTAQGAGDRAGAHHHYTRALDLGGDAEVVERFISNGLRLRQQERAGREERLDILRKAVAWANANQDGAAYRHVAKSLHANFNDYAGAFRFYTRAYDLRPIPEIAYDALGANGNYDFPAVDRLIQRVLRDFPGNTVTHQTHAWANDNFAFNPGTARAAHRRAVETAVTDAERVTAVGGFGDFLALMDDHNAAQGLYERYLPQLNGRDYRNLLGYFIDNRVAASAFGHAARLIEEAEQDEDFSRRWLGSRRALVAEAIRLSEQREAFYRENPFLLDWERRFGDSLRLSVEFETGKADLLPEGRARLDQAAKALSGAGADDYLFLLEGHTDSTGTDAVNMPLSEARAASVETYFSERHGIAPERLRSRGYGPRNPVAPNTTDAGRQANRRVEVRPFGNLRAPSVAVNGPLADSGARFSRDGRIAVVGNTPIQVWDTTRMARIHELPHGGSRTEISPNGRYLATATNFVDRTGRTTYGIFVYDLRTGHLISQRYNDTKIMKLDWSPHSDAFVYLDISGYVRVFDVTERRQRGITRVATIRGADSVLWLNDGETIVASARRRNDLFVLDADTLRLKGRAEGAGGWIHALGQTHDGARVVALNNDREMTVWTTDDWRQVIKRRMPILGKYAVGHPSRPWVVFNSHFDDRIGLAVVDLMTGEIISSGADDKQYLTPSWSPDGEHILTAHDGALVRYDAQRMEPVERRTGGGVFGYHLRLISERGLVLASDAAGTNVWSLKTGRRVHRIEEEINFNWRPRAEDGTGFVSATADGRVVSFDSETFRHETVLETGLMLDRMSVKGDYIVLAGTPETKGAIPDPHGEIVVLDRESLRQINRFRVDLVTEPLQYDAVYDLKFGAVTVDETSGHVAVFGSWRDGYGTAFTDGRTVLRYDLETGRALPLLAMGDGIWRLSYRENGRELWVSDRVRYRVMDPETRQELRREPLKYDYEIALDDGRNLRWWWTHVTLDGQSVSFPNSLRDLEVDESRNLAVGITNSNEVVLIALDSMQRKLTISAQANGEWIAYTPQGHYTASLKGAEGVYWSLGDDFLPFSALEQQYRRPNLIRDALAALAEGRDARQVEEEIAPDLFESPFEVSLVSQSDARTEAETYLLELSVVKQSADLPDPEIEYVLNGRPIGKGRGFDEEAFFEGAETVGISRRFDLRPGRNEIEAYLVWRGARLEPIRVTVHRESEDTQVVAARDQTLWFFGVGVSDYALAAQNLNFAHRDAQELEKMLRAQEGRLFKQVKTKVLIDDAATEREVRIAMREFLAQAAPEDVIVLFLAGHGATDAEEELYFITHDADLGRPYTGMPVRRFNDFLANRPINQQALLLLDICQSGAAVGRVVADDAVQLLTGDTGAVVFASSSGSQQSLESETYGGGHGAFTAALLEALRGMADTNVGDQDGFNSLQETILYTRGRVSSMTRGDQRPTLPFAADEVDYLLSAGG